MISLYMYSLDRILVSTIIYVDDQRLTVFPGLDWTWLRLVMREATSHQHHVEVLVLVRDHPIHVFVHPE